VSQEEGALGVLLYEAMTTPAPAPPRGIMRLLVSPALYITWTVLVFAALAATWPVDPYIFALATLIVGSGTIAIGLAGIIAQVKANPEIRTRVIIAGSVTASGILVAIALVMLSRVRWA
jgi:NADH:ubiquinone oxidoreductase subunit K